MKTSDHYEELAIRAIHYPAGLVYAVLAAAAAIKESAPVRHSVDLGPL
jgi:hypothetical protein